jgi:hypothetical protein
LPPPPPPRTPGRTLWSWSESSLGRTGACGAGAPELRATGDGCLDRCTQAAQWELQSQKSQQAREAEALAAAKRTADEQVESLRAENAALHERSRVRSPPPGMRCSRSIWWACFNAKLCSCVGRQTAWASVQDAVVILQVQACRFRHSLDVWHAAAQSLQSRFAELEAAAACLQGDKVALAQQVCAQFPATLLWSSQTPRQNCDGDALTAGLHNLHLKDAGQHGG